MRVKQGITHLIGSVLALGGVASALITLAGPNAAGRGDAHPAVAIYGRRCSSVLYLRLDAIQLVFGG